MFKGKGWFGGGLWKPKNPHSLEHLKYLHNFLSKNQIVTEQNQSHLVETLRSITEILIWGDQNDSTVFDFFLEKNMLSYFLKIMKQKRGRFVCVQLLQTLNILFENIRNETSLYYLLSNNHVNCIIVHKFDFSDEEVMAYYISFLKTLSLKLNSHTIHFFYNEHTHDFPLYTEAIKFFNHSESMVRIAVRTLTLNVYRVEDKSMLKFIRDKTAAPYFSNLVWFIGNHVLELDICVRNDADHQSRNRLSDLVAEHLDHLHYLNDILCLHIESLNDVLTDHLLNRLLIPLYVYSLTKPRRHSQADVGIRERDGKPHVSSVVSLFLLSQVFLIISHIPLVRQLADIILNRDMTIFSEEYNARPKHLQGTGSSRPGFTAPLETLEKSLENKMRSSASSPSSLQYMLSAVDPPPDSPTQTDNVAVEEASVIHSPSRSEPSDLNESNVENVQELNITDEEKQQLQEVAHRTTEQLQEEFSLSNRPYLEAIFNALDCSENDYTALFTLCLLYALGHNQGINQELLDAVLIPSDKSETKQWYNVNLMERIIKIISASCQYGSKVRLATLEMSIMLLKQLVIKNGISFLQDHHLATIEGAREESMLLLRNFYKSEEIFLDMFEDEYREMKKKTLNVEYLTMDSNILLPPTGTPLTGIEFSKRLPCGEVERARRTIRVFFLLRDLSLTLRMEPENQLPLTNPQACIQVKDVLDLNNSDLIACTVITKDSQKIRRFLVIDVIQLILVEPDTKRLGWGVAKFVGFLQDIEVTGDKDDSRCLHVTVHRPLSSASSNRIPLLSAKFVFDDHIRCMAAKQRLTKGRMKARQRKMHMIAKLLDLPGNIQPCPSPPTHAVQSVRLQENLLRRSGMQRSMSHEQGMRLKSSGSQHKPMFVTGNKVPGFAAVLRKEESSSHKHSSRSDSPDRHRRLHGSPSSRHSRSRESSPRVHHHHHHSSNLEEIPLDDLSKESPRARNGHQRLSAPNLPVVRLSPSSGKKPTRDLFWPSRIHHTTEHGVALLDNFSPESPPKSPSRKARSLSESCAPKTLRPADTPTLSLLEPSCELDGLVATCLFPPSDSDPVKEPANVGQEKLTFRETSDDVTVAGSETDYWGNSTPNLNTLASVLDISIDALEECGEAMTSSTMCMSTDFQENEVVLEATTASGIFSFVPSDAEDNPHQLKIKGTVMNI